MDGEEHNVDEVTAKYHEVSFVFVSCSCCIFVADLVVQALGFYAKAKDVGLLRLEALCKLIKYHVSQNNTAEVIRDLQ